MAPAILGLWLLAEPATLAVAPILRAPPERAVLASPAAAASLARAVEEQADRHEGVRVLRAEEIFVADAQDLPKTLLGCGPNAECLSASLTRLGARLGIVVSVNHYARPAFVDVRVVDTEKKEIVGSAPGPADPAAGTIEAQVCERTRALLEKIGHPLAAALRVDSVPPDATLELSAAGLSRKLSTGVSERVPPGAWTLRLSHEGYDEYVEPIELAPGERASRRIQLEEMKSGFPWLLTGVIVGVIVAGVVTYVVLNRPTCLCLGPENLPCEC
ncbi:MAG: PEGA domain-containing protein [Deltaproteobacteria bacterium]|nr:PEGA domain-containing protein [Deltaproteobacteria bacterium]